MTNCFRNSASVFFRERVSAKLDLAVLKVVLTFSRTRFYLCEGLRNFLLYVERPPSLYFQAFVGSLLPLFTLVLVSLLTTYSHFKPELSH